MAKLIGRPGGKHDGPGSTGQNLSNSMSLQATDAAAFPLRLPSVTTADDFREPPSLFKRLIDGTMKRTPDEIVDELLVMKSQDGDANAWRQLVKRWQPRFYAQARRLTAHRDGAADVTQETWIAIMRSIHRIEDPARFRAWAHRIVANKSADWIRRRQRERKALHNAADDLHVDQRAGSASGGEKSDAISKLKQAIRTLPSEHQHLLSMFYIENMSLIEIADVLAIPVGTVKSRLHSIRQELKLVIEGIQQ